MDRYTSYMVKLAAMNRTAGRASGVSALNTSTDRRAELRPVAVTVQLASIDVERIAQRAAEILAARSEAPRRSSPYLTIPEAAELLRTKRQRIDDLLSQGKLTRVKDGGRTLIARDELEEYLQGVRRGHPRGARRSAA